MSDGCMPIGAYVLATKYGDGDPGDQFGIGFYAGPAGIGGGRFMVHDGDGRPLRAGGFRRIKRISRRRGAWLLARIRDIESGDRSVWWWARQPMGGEP